MWSKLEWEAHHVQVMCHAGPPLDINGIVYTIQSACVSAVDLSLARAVANTLKHHGYRDHGLGDAEIRVVVLFTPEQHTRLRAAQDTEEFDRVHAEEAEEADIEVSFGTPDGVRQIGAVDFVIVLRSCSGMNECLKSGSALQQLNVVLRVHVARSIAVSVFVWRLQLRLIDVSGRGGLVIARRGWL